MVEVVRFMFYGSLPPSKTIILRFVLILGHTVGFNFSKRLCMVHISSFKSNPKTQYKDQISKISFPEIIANITSETYTETEAVFRRACVFFCYIY